MTLFLIGAGFNADARREAGPVYGKSIHVGRYQIDCGYPLVADVANLCFGLAQVPDGKSIEGLFSEALGRADYAPLEKLADWLMEADFRLATRLASPDASNCYREFFGTFAESHFLTFNYDSLPEIFLHRFGRWYPHDGYGVPVDVEPSFGASTTADQRSACLVLHLHGSFCVYTSEFETQRSPGDRFPWLVPRGRPRYGFDPDSISLLFSSYRRALPDTGHVSIEQRVIAPVPDKAEELKQPFIRETYDRAGSLVQESERLIAVGYSFNSHDRTSYGPILQALAESRERRLIVVSPHAGTLAERIRKEHPRLLIEPIEKTLKGWAAESFRC